MILGRELLKGRLSVIIEDERVEQLRLRLRDDATYARRCRLFNNSSSIITVSVRLSQLNLLELRSRTQEESRSFFTVCACFTGVPSDP